MSYFPESACSHFIAIFVAFLSPLLFQGTARADEPTYQGRTVTSWLQDVMIFHTSMIDAMEASKHAAAQEAAAVAIHAIGKDAVPVLIERLKAGSANSDIDYQPRTLWAFQLLGADAKTAVPDLIQLLTPAYQAAGESDPSKSDHTSINAAIALRGIGREAVPGLIEALSVKDAKIRFGAAGAMEWFGDSAADIVPALIRSIQDDDWMVRWRAARTIGAICAMPEISVPALTKRLQNESDANVRSYVIFALAKFGPKAAGAISELEKATSGSNPVTAVYAKEALEKIHPPAASQETKPGDKDR